MRGRFRSIYADLYVKGSHRSRNLPRLARPWRPRVIAWAGPAAFYRNRFYAMDQWYKARIDKPEIIPDLHIIDPDKYTSSLKERLEGEPQPEVDIGFKARTGTTSKASVPKEQLEKLARTMQLRVDLRQVLDCPLEIVRHFGVFEDLFGENVFFRTVQRMEVCYAQKHNVYHGNVLHAMDTGERPVVKVESVGGGFTTLVALSLDGNPYSNSEQLLHWLVTNVPDGQEVAGGTEVVPYMQALPFKGSGFHRFAFILFRHKESIDLANCRLESKELSARSFHMQKFYKENEAMLTPSAIAFSQVTWDSSVNRTLHELGMKAPLYAYEYRAPLKMQQKEFPNKAQPFDLYLDQFRDPLDVEADLLKKRLRLSEVDKRAEQPKYPDIDYVANKKNLPAWQHARLLSENAGEGKNHALWNNPLD